MNEKNMPGVMVYFDIRPTVDTLTDAEAGQLLRAILHYGELQTPVSFPDNRVLQVVWNSLEPRIDYERGKYAKKVAAQRRNARKRWDAMACQAMPTMPNINSYSNSDSDSNSNSNANSDISLPSFPPPGPARDAMWAETMEKAKQIRELRLEQERKARHRERGV